MENYQTRLRFTALAAGLCVLLGACAELSEDLPAPVASGGVHDASWNVGSAPESHGRYLKGKQWNDAECRSCHARDFAGGVSAVSCFTCHDAYPHGARFAGGGHPAYLGMASYPLGQCRSCHGASYDGGAVVDVSCSSAGCHVDNTGTAKSPEACNTCHGNFRALASDKLSWAPPKSVAGDTATTIAGVGAHDAHLAGATGGKEVKCAECHNVPDAASVLQVPHIDGIPRAEVVFNDTLARLVTGNGSYIPTAVAYDPASLRCSNTYCHGNWMATKSSAPIGMQFAYLAPDTAMRGGNVSPLWTGGAGEAVCGTCHALPPTGHLPAATNTCGSCHGEVVDNNLNIIDRSKHMNGKINAFASERAF